MSKETTPAPPTQPDPTSLPPTVLHSHKSYRRKYRKIMVQFERSMRESSNLFKDQERLNDISQRIAEQNDQILQLLLELNSQPQVPSRLRYNLNDPASKFKPEKHTDEQKAAEELRLSRYRVSKGETEQPSYEEQEHELLDSVEFSAGLSYGDLLQGGPLQRKIGDQPDSAGLTGLLTSKQEDLYLQSLDDFMFAKNGNPRAHAVNNLGNTHADKSADREREAQLRNPVSVYNWLRKNQPQVFLQDADSENKRVAAASRTSKRMSTAKAQKVEPELYDEEGIALDHHAGKGKRKRDEDGGYRPKGGHARSNKRRKEDSGGRRSKGLSMDAAAA